MIAYVDTHLDPTASDRQREVSDRASKLAFANNYHAWEGKGIKIFDIYFILCWAVPLIISVFMSQSFLANVTAGDPLAITLVLLLGLANTVTPIYQLKDARKPSARSKLLHGICSLFAAGLNFLFVAYNGFKTWPEPTQDRINIVALIFAAWSGFTLSANSFRLLIKARLENAKWTDYFRLVFYRKPPKGLEWESLPSEEKAWALEKRGEMLAQKAREKLAAHRG